MLADSSHSDSTLCFKDLAGGSRCLDSSGFNICLAETILLELMLKLILLLLHSLAF